MVTAQFLRLAIQIQMSKSTKVIPCIFALALTVFAVLAFQIFNLEKGHRLQLLQLCHSMANVKIYKFHFLHFFFLLRYDLCKLL